MKKLLFFILFLILSQITFSQLGKGISNTVDNAGYCYVTGYTTNVTTGDDILIAKYDQDGAIIWTRSITGDNNEYLDQGKEIKSTQSGYIYVIGNVGNLETDSDVMLIKYSSDGDPIWSITCNEINSTSEDKAFGIAVDESDNAFITGYSNQPGVTSIFTAKYNSAGVCQWSEFSRGSENLGAQGNAIVLDHSGNVIVTGFTTTADFGIDIFTIKYGPNGGEPAWTRPFHISSSNLEDKAFGIAVDESDNIYVVGYGTNDNINLDIVLLKYLPSGLTGWAQQYNSPFDDKAFGIAVDETDAYITGYIGTADAGMNYITLKYSLAYGDKLWQKIYDGTGGSDDEANSIGLMKEDGVTVGVVVTGQSVGIDNTKDYETLLYTSDLGDEVESSRYTGEASNDIAMQLAVAPDGIVYVTGGSDLIVNSRQKSVVKNQRLKMGSRLNHGLNSSVPSKYTLYQNYPNPFNPSTKIKFDLTKGSFVKISIYDLLGREVAVPLNQFLQSGTHEISYSGASLSSGTYFYELKTDDFRDVKKMILIK